MSNKKHDEATLILCQDHSSGAPRRRVGEMSPGVCQGQRPGIVHDHGMMFPLHQGRAHESSRRPAAALAGQADARRIREGLQTPRRRRLMLAAGGLLALSACGLADDEDYYYYLDDRNDATEVDLPMWRVLEIRLAVNRADGLLTFLNSDVKPELDYKEGPDYVAFDDRSPERATAYERWRFRAVSFGHTTIRFDYAPNRYAAAQRVVTFRVRVY